MCGKWRTAEKGKLEPYLKSSELRFDFDGLEAGYLWSKKDGIYPIRQESIAETYPKAEVFQWQDFHLHTKIIRDSFIITRIRRKK